MDFSYLISSENYLLTICICFRIAPSQARAENPVDLIRLFRSSLPSFKISRGEIQTTTSLVL